MTDQNQRDDRQGGLSGSELQQSQSGGGSGQFGGNRNQMQGSDVSMSDMEQDGGSSGSGGYGDAQNQQNHQGQQQQGGQAGSGGSRGTAFDEQQGGGRGVEDLTDQQQGGGSEFERDQQAHQDRGQSIADEEEDSA